MKGHTLNTLGTCHGLGSQDYASVVEPYQICFDNANRCHMCPSILLWKASLPHESSILVWKSVAGFDQRPTTKDEARVGPWSFVVGLSGQKRMAAEQH